MNRSKLRASRTVFLLVSALVLLVIIIRGIVVWGVEQSLKNAEMSKDDLVFGFLPARVGFQVFFEGLKADSFSHFFRVSDDIGDQKFVIDMIGWKQQKKLVPLLESIALANGPASKNAFVSSVSINEAVSFPGESFAEEYYRDFFVRITDRMRLNDEAIEVATETVVEELDLSKQD